MGKRLTEAQKESIISLYKIGRTPSDIAVFVSVGISTVHRVLRENGVPAHNQKLSDSVKKSKEKCKIEKQTEASESKYLVDELKEEIHGIRCVLDEILLLLK